MSPSNYPGGLDSHETNHADGVNEIIHADDINDLGDAVNKIEAELGTDPSSPSATVKARLDAISLGTAPYDVYTLNGAASVGATTMTLDRSTTLVTSGLTYVAIEPFSTNCEIRRVTTVSGVTLTVSALENAHSSAKTVVLFQGFSVPAEWFGAKGDNSNDDTTALQAGFDQLGPLNLQLDGGSRVYSVSAPLIWAPNQVVAHMQMNAKTAFAPAEANGAMVMNTGDVRTTFTAATSDVFTTPIAHGLSVAMAVVFKGAVPTGITAGKVYYVKTVPTSTTFTVSATMSAGVPGTTTDVTATGSGTVYRRVVSLAKVYVDDVLIYGRNVTGLNGAMLYIQQQSQLHKFRVDSCPGTGLHLIGQQALFMNFQSLDCGKALVLDNASFMYFYGANLERFAKGIHIITGAQSPSNYGGGAFSCGFWGLHTECNNSATAVFFDHEGSHHQINYDNVQISANTNGAKAWYVHTGNAATSGYTIREVRFVMGGTTNRPTAIDDTDRSISLDSWDDYRAHLSVFSAPLAPSSTTFPNPQEFMIAGPTGRYIKYGGAVGTAPSMTFRPGTAQTAAQTIWRTTADADATWIDKGGYLMTALHSAPADGDLAAGQMAVWFDQTNGAAKLMVKAKEAGGTVRTGSVSLT